jgi:anti-sigma regulatory factor (Ser/Thr protein kinase)
VSSSAMARISKHSHITALPTRRSGTTGPPPSDVAAQRPSVDKHPVGQVIVLDVTGPLSDVVEELDHAIRLALAQGPRGVACDMTRVVEVGAPGALRRLASAGRHPRDWPGVPVAVTSLGRGGGQTLGTKPLGEHLMVTATLPPALSAILQAARPAVVSRHLAPHPTAPRAARDLVSRTLLEWRLSQQITDACLVVSELVTNAIIHAGTDIDLTLAEHRGSVRLAVRDHSHALPGEQPGRSDQCGRGLGIVAELASSWGVLPHADGGKVVWAVLAAAARPERVTRRRRPALPVNPERPFR